MVLIKKKESILLTAIPVHCPLLRGYKKRHHYSKLAAKNQAQSRPSRKAGFHAYFPIDTVETNWGAEIRASHTRISGVGPLTTVSSTPACRVGTEPELTEKKLRQAQGKTLQGWPNIWDIMNSNNKLP